MKKLTYILIISLANTLFTAYTIDTEGNPYPNTPGSDTYTGIYGDTASTGIITTVAGTGEGGFSGDGGPATAAKIYIPYGTFVDRQGNLFIVEHWGNRVRRVDSQTGTITTVAGTGERGFSGDCAPGTESMLNYPAGVFADREGNLFIADYRSHRIRRVDSQTGIMTTIAGTGEDGYSGDGGPAVQAKISYPTDVFVNSEGDLLIADAANWLPSHHVRRVDSQTGIITTALSSTLWRPISIFMDPEGNLFTVHSEAYEPLHCVRRVDGQTGVITIVAGTGERGFSGDGGPATEARLNEPGDVFVDSEGNLFIADSMNHRVRRVDSQTGIITTVAGTGESGFSGDGGTATEAKLWSPVGVFGDSEGNLFITEMFGHRVRRVEGIAAPTTLEIGVPVVHPNLVIEDSSIGFSQDTAVEGEVIEVEVWIQNISTEVASQVTVNLYAGNPVSDGTKIGSDTVSSIAACGSAYARTLWNTWGFGGACHDIYAVIDGANGNGSKREIKIYRAPDGITKYYALLIGSGGWYNERRCKDETVVCNDVERVRCTLTDSGSNWISTGITSIVNEEVSENAIYNAMRDIGLQMDGDDVFLFYYSGHGDEDTGGLNLFSRDLLNPEDLRAALDGNIPAGAKSIVVLNACYSGSFVSEFNTTGRPNTFIISSCKSDEETPIFSWILLHPWTMSVFCYHFCSAIEGEGDLWIWGGDGNNEVSDSETYNYVKLYMPVLSFFLSNPQRYPPSGEDMVMDELAITKQLAARLSIRSLCPVDLVVTDPRGRTISKNECTIPSASYIEIDMNFDGDPDDKVVIRDVLVGVYAIEVVPEQDAQPTDTFSLDISYASQTVNLADEVQIQYIQNNPYDLFYPQYKLEPGWNLISIPFDLPNNELDTLLQPISDDCSCVYTYDAENSKWNYYFTDGLSFLNNCETLESGKGYWLKINKSCTLLLEGGEISDESISLKQGWNLVGYNCSTVRPIEDVLESIAVDCISVWTYDSYSQEWKSYVTNAPESPNSLTDMESGKGYYINVRADCIWTIPEIQSSVFEVSIP